MYERMKKCLVRVTWTGWCCRAKGECGLGEQLICSIGRLKQLYKVIVVRLQNGGQK